MRTSGLQYQLVAFFTISALLFQPALSYARGDSDRGRERRREDVGRRHEAPDRRPDIGRGHDRSRFSMHIDLGGPRLYRPLLARGVRYYYSDGMFYRTLGGRYVLVSPPFGAVVSSIPSYYYPVVVNGVTYFTGNGVYYIYTGYGYQVVPPPQVAVVQAVPEPMVVDSVWSEPPTKSGEGALLGGLLGAVAGGIIGHQMKGRHDVGGALIGAAVGATAGSVIGDQVPNRNAAAYAAAPAALVEAPAAVSPVAITSAVPAADPSAGPFALNIPKAQGGYTTVVIQRSGTGFTGPQGEYYAEFPKVAQLAAMYGD